MHPGLEPDTRHKLRLDTLQYLVDARHEFDGCLGGRLGRRCEAYKEVRHWANTTARSRRTSCSTSSRLLCHLLECLGLSRTPFTYLYEQNINTLPCEHARFSLDTLLDVAVASRQCCCISLTSSLPFSYFKGPPLFTLWPCYDPQRKNFSPKNEIHPHSLFPVSWLLYYILFPC